ncbi:MAG: DUF1152 domain-containing protein [Myxococcota bacterium]|nr:DUF1152 domain-containing protein [Myxococcota bacterium]
MNDILTAALLPDLPPTGRVLLAGAGGGYDVLGAVPLLLGLEAAGHTVHLGNLSFSNLDSLAKRCPQGVLQHAPGLYELRSEAATEDLYCPEAWLARWLAKASEKHASSRHSEGIAAVERPVPESERRLSAQVQVERSVWAWHKSGVRPMRAHFDALGERLGLDAIVLIDGGIDLILRGDESSIGTPAEDLSSLAAARASCIPIRRVSCLGLGAELRDGIRHEQVFSRIAELTRLGGYLGASALVGASSVGRAYRDAVEFVFSHQQRHHLSHVHRVVLAAMAGEYGATAPHVWLSPLLNLYWHFELDTVADSHLFLEHLASTQTIGEVTLWIEGLRKGLRIQPQSVLPL